MNDVDPRLVIVKIWNAVAARDNVVPPVTICGIGEFKRETITIWKEDDFNSVLQQVLLLTHHSHREHCDDHCREVVFE